MNEYSGYITLKFKFIANDDDEAYEICDKLDLNELDVCDVEITDIDNVDRDDYLADIQYEERRMEEFK